MKTKPSIAGLAVAIGFAAWGCACAATGPLLSDAALFSALNLDYPGLALVKADVAGGNTAAAVTHLGAYLRGRTNTTWFFDPHAVTNAVSYNRSQADATATGTVTISGIAYTFPYGDIDWFFNVTTNPANGYAPNNEWLWQLNRMTWWSNLGQAYWGRSRHEPYAQAWVGQLRDWIAECPAQSTRKNGAGSAWRTIETGLRMSTYWPEGYHRFLESPAFTDADIVLYLKSCVEQARYLYAFYTQANFLTMEMSGLYTVGALYPELQEASTWRTFAAQRLHSEQNVQFLPDGWHYELAPGYHTVAIDNTLKIYTLAMLEGLDTELPADYLAGLEKAYEALLYMTLPNRVTPPVNDSNRNTIKTRLLEGARLFPHRLDFLWVATEGSQGLPPAYTSFSFPYGGFNLMRSGWETLATCAVFDAGALGQSTHRHEDTLALQLWCHGREILFDHGAGNYETSLWRTYSMSSYGHNTVVVDGREQKGGDGNATLPDPDYVPTQALPMRWESDIAHDFAAGTYARGYSNYTHRPAAHTRRVLFVKPDIYLVADTLVPASPGVAHTYEARWNLLPTNTVTDPVTKTIVTAESGVPNLAIVPCLVDGLAVDSVVARNTNILSQLLGWKVQSGTTTHIPCTTVTHTRSGPGTHHFLTLFLPLAADAPHPVATVTATSATSADVRLHDGRTLSVYADSNPARGLRVVELSAAGTTNRAAGAGFVPPTLSALSDTVMGPNQSLTRRVTVDDPDSGANALMLSGRALDPALLPPSGIILGGSGKTRSVTLTPAPGASGATTVILTATDPDGSTTSVDFRLIVDALPIPSGISGRTLEETPATFDLRAFTVDDLTPVSNLLFTLTGATGGNAVLLPDGCTVHFTPASNFFGTAAIAYTARDMAADPRLFLHVDFEQAALATNLMVADVSGHARHLTFETVGTGVGALTNALPAPLARVTQQACLLRESGNFNGARLRLAVATNALNFSDQSWTFSGWFNRAAQTNEDFIFYIGRSDGFGSNEELQLYGYPGAATLGVRHYIGEATTDVELAATGIETDTWHHAAVTFERTAPRTGVIALYLDGQLAGRDSTLTFNLDQSVPITFGGHHSPTFAVTRWFNGLLDDLALFDTALSAVEIAALATQSVGHFGGQNAALIAPVTVTDVNDPPIASAGQAFTRQGAPVEIDLRTLTSDLETPTAGWLFALSNASNGAATLLADGHTVRFAPQAGFNGNAGFTFTVTDTGQAADLLLHYAFEPPDTPLDATATDASGNGRDGTLAVLGDGDYEYASDAPFPLFNAACLALTQNATAGAAKLSRTLAATEHNLSDADWSFAGWFRRSSRSDDDFIFYVGNDNGFSGGGDELQLYAPANANTLRLYHYDYANVQDIILISAATAPTGQWHHAALTFTRTNANAGIVRAYLNGTLFGTAGVAWSLRQDKPLVFGGHASTGTYERLFNGTLDELALFARALSDTEVATLVTQTVQHAGGLSAANRVTVRVLAPASLPQLSAASIDDGNGWRMTLNGPSDATYTVFASTNLTTWTPLDTLTAPALPHRWYDLDATNFPRRFYRVLLTPSPQP